MSKTSTGSKGALGVTISEESNAVLELIKDKTGASKSKLANALVAEFAPGLLSGDLIIVNGRITKRTRSSRKAA